MSNRIFHAFSTLMLFFSIANFCAGPSWANDATGAKAEAKKALHLDMLHETVPDIELQNGAGAVSHLVDYRGKNIILHFWASWCEPCKKELADLSTLSKAGSANGVVLIPVSADNSVESKQVSKQTAQQIADAQKFLAQVPGQLPFFIAAPSKNLDRFLTWGIPVTYFIDRSGKLIARAMGPRDWSSQTDLAGTAHSDFWRRSLVRRVLFDGAD